jgi:hypothetical protein
MGRCGLTQPWRKLTRDLVVDLHKGLAYQNKPKRKLSRLKLKVCIHSYIASSILKAQFIGLSGDIVY